MQESGHKFVIGAAAAQPDMFKQNPGGIMLPARLAEDEQQQEVMVPSTDDTDVSLHVVNRMTGKGYKSKVPKNEVVSSLLSYIALALTRGDSIRCTMSDENGELLKLETRTRKVDQSEIPAEILHGDVIDIVKAADAQERESREAAAAIVANMQASSPESQDSEIVL